MEDMFNGRRVRSRLVDAGMTQEELAEQLHVKIGTLKSWIYGQRSIAFDDAVAIADVFGKR
ncbi:helix-turn-helix domain-containing protein [Gordonibacter urolithinfaciens]|uniref:helix-turn-helix domain-containing protein n=1 Tax=Gordonibacter urolithinfaciens TaxID=1335613 RepID=UPI003AAED22A